MRYILVPSLSSPCASVCVRTAADSLLKSPGWRKVWKDEPRILLTGDGFSSFFLPPLHSHPILLLGALAAPVVRACLETQRRSGPGRGPSDTSVTVASFTIKGQVQIFLIVYLKTTLTCPYCALKELLVALMTSLHVGCERSFPPFLLVFQCQWWDTLFSKVSVFLV